MTTAYENIVLDFKKNLGQGLLELTKTIQDENELKAKCEELTLKLSKEAMQKVSFEVDKTTAEGEKLIEEIQAELAKGAEEERQKALENVRSQISKL